MKKAKDRFLTVLVFGITKKKEEILLGNLTVALSKKYIEDRISVNKVKPVYEKVEG